jgi:hypothetical protein
MESYPRAAVERTMKIQEVILRAVAKKITWAQAGEIIGLCERQMRRWKERYEEFGYDGLFDHRWGKPSPKRVPLALVEEVLRLYQEQYGDFNVRHFSREVARAAPHPAELHVGEARLADRWAGAEEPETRGTSTAATTTPAAGDAAASGWQLARLVSGSPSLRLAGDSGRRHQRDLLRTTGRRGMYRPAGGDRAERRFLCAVQRSRQPFLVYPEGRPAGGSPAPDAGGSSAGRVGDPDDPGLLTASARKRGTEFRHLARTVAAGTAPSGNPKRGEGQ